MSPESGATPGHCRSEVMASVDGDGSEERLVIADISADGEWLSMATAHTVPLAAIR